VLYVPRRVWTRTWVTHNQMETSASIAKLLRDAASNESGSSQNDYVHA